MALKTYFINLDRSEDRRAWIESTARRLRIDVVRVPGIDGRLIADGDLPHRLDFKYRNVTRPLTRGEVGCLQSHIKAWELVAGADDEWAFIVEDDVHLSGSLPGFLATSDWIPADADIVKAETDLTRQTVSHAVSGHAFGRKIRELMSDHSGSAAYFISRRACLALLADRSANIAPVDMVLFQLTADRYHELKVFQIEPAIAIQDRLLDADGSHARLSSTLDIDRLPLWPAGEKPRGTRKILREALRVVRQAGSLALRLRRRMQRHSIVLRKIPFRQD